MKITLQQPHKSIETLQSGDLPNYVALVGRNGVGKTQILEALSEGFAEIEGISPDDVQIYNASSFNMHNPGQGSRNSDLFVRETANAYLSSSGGQSPAELAKEIFDQLVLETERGGGTHEELEKVTREQIRQIPDFPTQQEFREGHPYLSRVYQEVLAPLDAARDQERARGNRGTRPQPNRRAGMFNGNVAALVGTAAKLSGKLFHELTSEDVLRATHYEGNLLRNTISEVFAAYKLDQFNWIHRQFESADGPVSYTKLAEAYEKDHPSPWKALREALDNMRDMSRESQLFNFQFSDPGTETISMDGYREYVFRTEMTNLATGARYDPGSLSSGERILMALCLASFNSFLGRRVPKLLLLDELDSVLHPSMMEALVVALKDLFVAHGTKVMITSHSPVMVAALDEADIYQVTRAGRHVTITQANKAKVVEELSERIATVEVGLRIASHFDSKVVILSEGNNTMHLKRWAELFFPNDVGVFEGLESNTGKNELVLYGRMLARMSTDSHFLLVWDCDATKEANTLTGELASGCGVTAFAFSRRESNAMVRKGVENNYEEHLLKDYVHTTFGPNGEVVSHAIASENKRKLASYIYECGSPEDFVHFKELHEVVDAILGSTCS